MFDSLFDKDDLSTTTMTHFSGDWQDIYRYQLALEEQRQHKLSQVKLSHQALFKADLDQQVRKRSQDRLAQAKLQEDFSKRLLSEAQRQVDQETAKAAQIRELRENELKDKIDQMKQARRNRQLMKMQNRRECSQLIQEQNRLDQQARDLDN